MEDGFEEPGDVDCVYVVLHYQREGEVLKYRRSFQTPCFCCMCNCTFNHCMINISLVLGGHIMVPQKLPHTKCVL